MSEQEQEDAWVEPFSEEEMRAAQRELLHDIYEEAVNETL